MTFSAQFFQPYLGGTGYVREGIIYDPRGDAFPYLYEFGGPNELAGLWRLNRRTGVIDTFNPLFNPNFPFGPGDMDTAGNLWWTGQEASNLTSARQAQTKFAADTFAKIGSLTSNGTTILYPAAGQVRVDRHSSHHFVAQIDQADIHPLHGNLYVWDGVTRINTYFLDRTTWYNQPVGGTLNRVWDLDFDNAGNLWCVTIDDNALYILLWKVAPDGTQTMVTDLSSHFPTGHIGIPMIRWVASDNSLVIAAADHLVKCQVSDGTVIGTGTAPVVIQFGENYQSFHHTIDQTSLYLCEAQLTGPIFYEINLLTLATARTIDFAGVAGCVGTFWNGISQSYDAPRYFRPITALYDPVLGGVWCEEFFEGVIGAFIFEETTEIHTTQLVIEVVVRPQPTRLPVDVPPPVFFDTKYILQQLTGPALPMEVCGGYVGNPPIKSQLQQVRAQYTKPLAPLSSKLQCFHTEQIGRGVTQGPPGTLNPQNSWFTMRQTDRYHRVCLVCEGEAEVTGLTYSLREAGVR